MRPPTSRKPTLAERLEPRRLLAGDAVGPLGDPSDFNDQISEAFRLDIGFGTTQSPQFRIDPRNDVDIFEIPTFRGTIYEILVGNNGVINDRADLVVRLFDQAGNELRSQDLGGPGDDEFLFFQPDFDGPTYLGISSSPNDGYDPITGTGDIDGAAPFAQGPYDVQITWQESPLPPDPNDQLGESGSVNFLGPVFNRLDFGDVDIFTIPAQAGFVYGFDVDTLPGEPNTFARIYDLDGNILASNDAAGDDPGGPGDDPFLEFRAPATTDYYLAISGVDNLGYDPITGGGDNLDSDSGNYTLTSSDEDANNEIAQAIPAAVGTPVNARLQYAGDVDLYAIAATAGQRLDIDLDAPTNPFGGGEPLDTYLRLFDAAGNELAANDDAPAPGEVGTLESFLSVVVPVDGTYHVGVSDFANRTYAITANSPPGPSTNPARQVGAYTLEVSLGDAVPPQVAAQAWIFEDRQAYRVTFDEAIDPASVSRNDFTVNGGGAAAGLATFDVFEVPGTGGRGWELRRDIATSGPLPNGIYSASITPGSVTDLAGNPLANGGGVGFRVLAGDATGDGRVDLADFGILRANFGNAGAVFSDGNFDYVGGVGLADFGILRANFGITVGPIPIVSVFEDEPA